MIAEYENTRGQEEKYLAALRRPGTKRVSHTRGLFSAGAVSWLGGVIGERNTNPNTHSCQQVCSCERYKSMTQAWACLLVVVSLLARNQAFVLRGAPAHDLKLTPGNHDPVCSTQMPRLQREGTALPMAGDEQEDPGLSVKAAW